MERTYVYFEPFVDGSRLCLKGRMPLLADSLSIWEIGFRWAGRDPAGLWLRIPLDVRDNLQSIAGSIRCGDLFCGTLECVRYPASETEAARVRGLASLLGKCEYAERFERKFLKDHHILRFDFAHLCEKTGVPFPEFWFPPGWKTDDEYYPASLRRSHPTVDATPVQTAAGGKHAPDSREAVSEKARRAALARHEPIQRIKEELFAFWDAGGFPSQAEAVRRFVKLKGMESLRPLTPSNAQRTLSEALSKHVKAQRES
jgi:hypothetical protein